jgi:hypothetical protein
MSSVDFDFNPLLQRLSSSDLIGVFGKRLFEQSEFPFAAD